MNEENFSLQGTLEANYLNIELPDTYCMDEIAVRVIRDDCPDFLVPFGISNVNGNITLKYKLVNMIALEYFDKTMTKEQFLKLYLNLLLPFMDGKKWFLDYHSFCIDPRYVFVDRQESRVHFIYVPELSYYKEESRILQFFKDVFTSAVITDSPEFQVKIYQFFSRRDVNLTDLYQLLVSENKKAEPLAAPLPASDTVPLSVQLPSPDTVPSVPLPPSDAASPALMPSPFSASAQQAVKESKLPFLRQKKENKPQTAVELGEQDTNVVIDSLFGEAKKDKHKKKTAANDKAPNRKKEGRLGLFGKKKEKESTFVLPQVSVLPQTAAAAAEQPPQPAEPSSVPPQPVQWDAVSVAGMPVRAAEESDRTEIAEDDFMINEPCLELIDSVIPGAISRISLNFVQGYITIGRMSSDEVKPDVAFAKEFTRIGRRHARIEKGTAGYQIIDLGSANHTLLNGQVLIPNQPYLLTNGAELVFTMSKPVRYRVKL